MKNILFIHNPLIKLIYVDCYLFAKQHQGVVFKTHLLDLFERYESLNSKLDNLEFKKIELFFLRKLTKTDIKNHKLKASTEDFFFEEVCEELKKEAVLSAFYEQGLDPYLFVETAVKNSKRGKYKFNSLQEAINASLNTSEEVKNQVEEVTQDLSDEVHYNSEKWFNLKKIRDCFMDLPEVEFKGMWNEIKQYLVKEGKTEKEANAVVAKLIKEEGVSDIFHAFKEIKQRKSTPPAVIPAIIFQIRKMEEKAENVKIFPM